MPVVAVPLERLRSLLRADVSAGRLAELLDELGCDVDGVVNIQRYRSRVSGHVIEVMPAESLPLTDPLSGTTVDRPEQLWEALGEESVVRLDLLPVRPDLFDAGGLARALRGYLGLETGLPAYEMHTPPAAQRFAVEVDPRLHDPALKRPFIQCAIVRGVSLDLPSLRSIMKLQENLHWALARDRKFASIGAYDLARLQSPIAYTLVSRADFRFTPLFWGGRAPVSPEVMLSEHPKGRDYAPLLAGMSLVPALLSANGSVLSLPPVINAEETKVTEATTDLFIDVTGSDWRVVTKALAILSTNIVEMDPGRAARIESVEIRNALTPDGSVESLFSPLLAAEEWQVGADRTSKLLGLELSAAACVELLQKMRHSARLSEDGAAIRVAAAAYRADIMHEVDLIEDIAVAYGYHNIEPALVPSFTAGSGLPLSALSRQAAAALCGLGFTESLSLVLTSPEEHYDKLRLERNANVVRLQNPVSADQTMLREHLYSSLLGVLALNTDQSLPQRIFEVGDVVRYCGDLGPAEPPGEPGLRPHELRVAAAAICAAQGAGFAAGRSTLDALLRELLPGLQRLDSNLLGATPEYRAQSNPTALPGRSAAVYLGAKRIAEVFEVHPEVLDRLGLGSPVVLLSLLLGQLRH